MSSVERRFERYRSLNVDLVTLASRVDEDWTSTHPPGSGLERTLAAALRSLAAGERALERGEDARAIEAYDACLKQSVDAWMNGTAESSALVASACGMLEDARASRGGCATVAYRAVAGTALSGRALAHARMGRWSVALRDGESAIDSAPDAALAHARLGEILRLTEAAGDVAGEYAKFAEALKDTRMNGLRRSNDFMGDSVEDLPSTSSRVSASKCIEEEDWVHARTSMLFGAGTLFAGRDDERIYRDRMLFLERAKTIFVAKSNESKASNTEESAKSSGTWLDNAFLLAGFDNMSAYDRAHVCLTIGNIFSWVGHFSGASELYSCGLSVIVNTELTISPEPLDDLQPVLEVNRVLSQYRGDQITKAWKNVRKLMMDSKRENFAPGFLRIAEIASAKSEWESAEQSFRIAGRLDAALQVRHKVVLAQRAAMDARPAMVDIEQLEELDKLQEGTEMDFTETPRFAETAKQNSLTDKSAPEHFTQAAADIVNELQEAQSPESQDSQSSQSKVFTGVGSRSLCLTDVMRDLDGAVSPGRRKRKTRSNSCSCAEVFSFLGWGSLEVRESSAEEELFLAALLEATPGLADDDGMDLDEIIEAATPAPIEVQEAASREQ